ncbi:acetyl-CoA carboxylase biotin carboxyl carrier protein [Peribacillus saganii]|uniref:Biotin carboxyl carrier protein of acetyl-CoA carboxylase n=1 Tax=Peribacillus saganii TaxID=2303992 RepID=A0A372LQ58_9BACI|nr:acetyl-CoA carboxylase biotin carboxyl carrier protein [Peribacillus saganii]RFU69792.1 acetyl-CoA carboxylase biotin carboxyl carrier protein [Peribacillus saganii]
MLKVQEIRELIKLVDQSSISEFTYEAEGTKIEMKKPGSVQPVSPAYQAVPVQAVQTEAVPAPVQPQAAAIEAPVAAANAAEAAKTEKAEENLHKIVSPMVGTFYQSSTPGGDAYVQVGSKVNKESVVCIVEAMKLFNEIEAEVNGEIAEILVKDGQLVEYGQPLFLVRPV